MQKKILATGVTAALLVLALAGCASNSASTATSASTSSDASSSVVATDSATSTAATAGTSNTQSNASAGTANGATGNVAAPEFKITQDEAKAIAIEHAGVQESAANYVFVEQDYDDGMAIYEIEFMVDGVEYNYDINGQDGSIMSFDQEIEYVPAAQGQ